MIIIQIICSYFLVFICNVDNDVLYSKEIQVEYGIFLDESKTRTYKNAKMNKINEIEMEKLTKTSHQTPQCTHKSISRFSTNNTYNTKKIIIIQKILN